MSALDPPNTTATGGNAGSSASATNEDLRALLRQGLAGVDSSASEAAARKLQEQIDFEALQQQYGFAARTRTGRCFSCGQAGHWATEWWVGRV